MSKQFYRKDFLNIGKLLIWLLLCIFIVQKQVYGYDSRHVIISKEQKKELNSTAIVADIGGTKARFALVYPDGRINNVWETSSQKYNSLPEMVEDYYKKLPAQIKKQLLILSIPAFIDDNYIVSNDLPKIMGSIDELYSKLESIGFNKHEIYVFNDVFAAGVGVFYLSPEEYQLITQKEKSKVFSALVIGCGTGYGQALVYSEPEYFSVYQNEGGFETLPVVTPKQIELLKDIQQISGKELITKREIVSGKGLLLLYKAIAYQHKTVPIAQSCEEIIEDALRQDNTDRSKLALETIDYFTQFLGLSISNSILSNLADSVYIFGGLIQSLDQKGLLNKNELTFWIAKGDRATLQKFLERSSVYLIKITNPTFIGLKILAQHKIHIKN